MLNIEEITARVKALKESSGLECEAATAIVLGEVKQEMAARKSTERLQLQATIDALSAKPTSQTVVVPINFFMPIEEATEQVKQMITPVTLHTIHEKHDEDEGEDVWLVASELVFDEAEAYRILERLEGALYSSEEVSAIIQHQSKFDLR